MTLDRFFACLLLALRAHRESFKENERLHRSFVQLLDNIRVADEVQIKGIRWVRLDPMFTRSHDLDMLLTNAMADLLIDHFSRRNSRLVLTVTPEQAKAELLEGAPNHVAWFEEQAAWLHEHLD